MNDVANHISTFVVFTVLMLALGWVLRSYTDIYGTPLGDSLMGIGAGVIFTAIYLLKRKKV